MAGLESHFKECAKIAGYMGLYATNEFFARLPDDIDTQRMVRDPTRAHEMLMQLQRTQAGILGNVALCYARTGNVSLARKYARKAASEYFMINDNAKKE